MPRAACALSALALVLIFSPGLLLAADNPPPIYRSLGEMAKGPGPAADGPNFLASRWALFPSVLVLDFKDFSAQDRTFSRLAFFTEKSGYRGRLLTDEELAGLHGWNAHDYGPRALAAFFNAARKAAFPLDEEEKDLMAFALREGLIVPAGPGFAPGVGALLSISGESDIYARHLLLAHESYHGIFFTDPEYRKLCYSAWDAAEKNERLFVLRLLGYIGYDTGSRELTVNEFQAYLLQQPASMLESYIRRMEPILANNPGFTTPSADSAIPGLLADEKRLEAFLRKNYGIGAGGAYGPAQDQLAKELRSRGRNDE